MNNRRAANSGDDQTATSGGSKSKGVKITRGRKSLHLLRKVFHALAGVALASVYEVKRPTSISARLAFTLPAAKECGLQLA